MKWAAVVAAGAALVADAAQVQDRRISDVVSKLEEMMETSKSDGKNDRKIYAKLKCYCDSNTEEKTTAIDELTKEKGLLEAQIEKLLGSSGKLSREVAQLKADMEQNEADRKKAEALREKEAETFDALKTDHEAAIASMKEAIETLAEIGADQTAGDAAADHATYMKEGAFLSRKVNVGRVHKAVEAAFVAASSRLSKKDATNVHKTLMAMQTKGVLNEAYTSQSGEIIGILKSMLDTFEANLAEATSTEKAAIKAHNDFMKTKREEHATMKGQKTEKEGELGRNDSDLGDARTTLEEVEGMLAEDTEFLAQLTDMCSEKKKQYDTKTTLRTEEEAAISQAISILNSDEAFDTFGKTQKIADDRAAGFVQIKAHNKLSSRQNVLKMLLQASKQTSSLKLAKIAMLVQTGNPFATVLSKIREMIELIDEEEKTDDEKFGWCADEQKKNRDSKKEKEDAIAALNVDISGLKTKIGEDEESLAGAQTDLAQNLADQKEATETRADEKAAYDENIKNLVSSQSILAEAIKVLDAFYSRSDLKTDEGELAGGYDALTSGTSKTEGRDDAHTATDFKDANTKGGNAVLELLNTINNDTAEEEKAAHTAEDESIAAYDTEMGELKKNEKTTRESIADFEEKIAQAKETLLQKEEDLAATIADKEAIIAYLAKIEPGCTFIQDNIDNRKANRVSEKSALEGAIKLLEASPAFTNANTNAYHESLGECLSQCEGDSTFDKPCQNGPSSADGDVQCSAQCEACLSGVSVPAYCTSHKGATGC